MAASAAGAQAKVYCVPVPTAGCTDSRSTLAFAITAANANAGEDTIVLAPGTFSGGGPISDETHIIGAGQDQTVIDGGSSPAWGVEFDHPSSSIQDLKIHEPSGGPSGGLYLAGSAQRVSVDLRDNPVDSSIAVSLSGDASFVDGAALASMSSGDYGLTISDDGDALVSNVQVQGRSAITTDGAGTKTLRFIRATGDDAGLDAGAAGTVLEDSTVSGGPVIGDLSGGTGDILTTVRHVTLKGSYIGASSDGHRSTVVVSNTAIVGGGDGPETADIKLDRSNTGIARVEADYSFFRSSHVVGAGNPGLDWAPGAHNVDGSDANLLDIVRGDLRPHWNSPLVDAGDPAPAAGEPVTDLAGGDRTVSGRTDIGAYEYGRHTPTISVIATPASVLAGDPVHFGAKAEDADPNEFPDVTWVFDDGTTANGLSVSHAFATPGTHKATATATDPAGLTATTAASVVVSAPIPPRTAVAPTFGFKSLKARKGVVRVVLRCPVIATDCAGTVELRFGRKLFGRARYAIAHGTKKTTKVRLSKAARKRLRRARRGLRVKVVAKPKGAASKSKAVRLTGR
jgi:PKD domain